MIKSAHVGRRQRTTVVRRCAVPSSAAEMQKIVELQASIKEAEANLAAAKRVKDSFNDCGRALRLVTRVTDGTAPPAAFP